MKLAAFDPPGHLDDLDAQGQQAWSRWISRQIDSAGAGDADSFDFDGPRLQFYNATKTDTAADAAELDITWTAFPKVIQSHSVSDLQRWKRADARRDVQDEYCEWSLERREDGKITRVTFTCEGPEYWEFLAAAAPEKVLALYREHVDPTVAMEDLVDGSGRYQPRNRWNNSTVEGAMHLIQGSNTLGAEIELAGGSSVVRVIQGRVLEGDQELIKCGQYGEPGRHSDPSIGARVNALARRQADVTLKNPVGLYFDDLVTAGWAAPDGSDPKQYWQYRRGSAGHHVRAVYEVPAAKGFTVGDIKIAGKPIQYAAQIADFISMKLTGVACRFGQSTVAPFTGCRRPRGAGLVELTVESALARRARTR